MANQEKMLALDTSWSYDPEMQVACVECTLDPSSVDKDEFKRYMESLVGDKEIFESGRIDLDEVYKHPVKVTGFVPAPSEERAKSIIDKQIYINEEKGVLNIPGAKLVEFEDKDGSKEISYEKSVKEYESTNGRNNKCMDFYQEVTIYINEDKYKSSVSHEKTEFENPNNYERSQSNSYYKEDGTLIRSEKNEKVRVQEKGISNSERTVREFDENGSCTRATQWKQTPDKNEKTIAVPGFQVTLTEERHEKTGNKYKDVDISVMNQTTGQTIEGTLRKDDGISSRLLDNSQMAVNNVGINIDIMEEINEIGNMNYNREAKAQEKEMDEIPR